MRKPKVAAVVVPHIKRYTIDMISKYMHRPHKNLVELLFLYPNFGQGFKIFMKIRPKEYYIIDNVVLRNNRHGKILGIFHRLGQAQNKIIKVRNTLQVGRWQFEPPVGKFYTDNALEYDIQKTEQLIDEKRQLLAKRSKMLGLVDNEKLLKEELKKKKLEQSTKKKK